MPFQTYVTLTMLQTHTMASSKSVKLMERSLFSARYLVIHTPIEYLLFYKTSLFQILFCWEYAEQWYSTSGNVQYNARVVQLHSRECTHSSRFNWWVIVWRISLKLLKLKSFILCSLLTNYPRGSVRTHEGTSSIRGKVCATGIFKTTAWITRELVNPWITGTSSSGTTLESHIFKLHFLLTISFHNHRSLCWTPIWTWTTLAPSTNAPRPAFLNQFYCRTQISRHSLRRPSNVSDLISDRCCVFLYHSTDFCFVSFSFAIS